MNKTITKAFIMILVLSFSIAANITAFADEAKVMTVKEIEPNLTINDIVKVEINVVIIPIRVLYV